MYKLIAFALIAAVGCNDLIQGPEGGRKIYDENKDASPAIWKQTSEVTVKANDTDVISRVAITDLRADKDGEAKIIKGGPGQKNVTIELKSPTILRGFDFHIEVYAVEDDQQITYPDERYTEVPYPEEVPVYTEEIPVMENDTKVNPDTKITKTEDVSQKDTDGPVTEVSTTAGDKERHDHEAPVTNGSNASVDPIVKFVNENNTEIIGEVITKKSMPLKSYSLVLSNNPQLVNENKSDAKATTTETPKLHPQFRGKDEESKEKPGNSDKAKTAPTAETSTIDHETSESVTEDNKANLNMYRDISKELGERVLFGIKNV